MIPASFLYGVVPVASEPPVLFVIADGIDVGVLPHFGEKVPDHLYHNVGIVFPGFCSVHWIKGLKGYNDNDRQQGLLYKKAGLVNKPA
jgi:hypothetical protein